MFGHMMKKQKLIVIKIMCTLCQGHIEKRARALCKLINSGTLFVSDKEIVQELIDDLNDALKG